MNKVRFTPQPGSPAAEFEKLVTLYLDRFGESIEGVAESAKLGRVTLMRIHEHDLVEVRYLPPCAAQYKTIWVNDRGFLSEDWYPILERLRNVLVLDRLADV